MKTKQIFKELESYLSPVQIIELKITIGGLPGSISMCRTISNIIKTYNSNELDERKLAYYLALLCKNHFAKIEYPKK